MPFIFANGPKVIHRGLNSLFPFKSVPFPAVMPKLRQPSYCSCFSHCGSDPSPKVPVHVCHTRKTLLNHVFEDLRKTKAPNSSPSQYQFVRITNSDCDMDEGPKPKVQKNTFPLLE
jgi:hypothetical protein